MILDTLENSKKYENVYEGFKAAFDFLRKAHEDFPAVGKYELDGEKVFALVQEYETVPGEETKWEAHKKYIDIQFVHDGSEIMGWDSINNLPAGESFHEDWDAYLYEGPDATRLELHSGAFAVFFPEDLHKPKGMYKKPSPVKKIVVKVLV